MNGMAAAVAFLTRLPVGRLPGGRHAFDAEAVARSARWFPLVGVLLGWIYAGVAWLCSSVFPALVTAVLLAGVDAALTGAMHLDGLADTADGLGGGRSREDALRIMRDHAIGAYGAVAVGVALLVRVAAVAGMIEGHRVWPAVVIAPVLGRWSVVLIGNTQKYAREGESPARWMGRVELIIATVIVLLVIVAVMGFTRDFVRGPAAWAAIAIVSAMWGRWCRRRLGGVTGDTLGAGVEISECLALLVYLAKI